MLSFEKTRKFTIKELSSFLEIDQAHPYFSRLLKYLREISIITEIEIIGSTKFLSLKYHALRKLIWKQKITNKWIDLFVDHYTSSINYI